MRRPSCSRRSSGGRATKLLTYHRPTSPQRPPRHARSRAPGEDASSSRRGFDKARSGTMAASTASTPKGPNLCQMMRGGDARAGHRHHDAPTRTIASRHAHGSHDLVAVAGAYADALPGSSRSNGWGGATFDVAMRFLTRIRGSGWRKSASGCRTSFFRCSSRLQRRRLRH